MLLVLILWRGVSNFLGCFFHAAAFIKVDVLFSIEKQTSLQEKKEENICLGDYYICSKKAIKRQDWGLMLGPRDQTGWKEWGRVKIKKINGKLSQWNSSAKAGWPQALLLSLWGEPFQELAIGPSQSNHLILLSFLLNKTVLSTYPWEKYSI